MKSVLTGCATREKSDDAIHDMVIFGGGTTSDSAFAGMDLMALAWENNPNGICEDAPCCGCCGPNGDGAFDPDEPPDESYEDSLNEYDEDYEETGVDRFADRVLGSYFSEHLLSGSMVDPQESPDPNWMND